MAVEERALQRSETGTELARSLHERLAGQGLDLPVRLWDGTTLGPDDAPYRLVLAHPWSLRSTLLPPTDLAAGEAYVHGDVDVEGSMVAALRDVSRVSDLDLGWATKAGLAVDLLRLPRSPSRKDGRRARLRGRRHRKRRDAEAVRFHYDLSNDFYRLWLDERMVYSCAYFADDDRDLDRAQFRKLDLICRKLRLEPGERFLDIGCGWGSLVLHAAEHYGVRAVGITLSEQQASLARARVADMGLEDRVEIHVQDYRDVGGEFDAVASVGMVEHVGVERLGGYFDACYRLTAPGGRFLNHGITTGRRREPRDLGRAEDTFVGAYVFPDGALVPASTAVTHMEDAGFELIDVEQLRPHYALTLQAWVSRLESRREEAVAAVGEQPYRIWRAYMAGSVVGFESGDLGVIQTLGVKGARLPLGRRWMLPAP